MDEVNSLNRIVIFFFISIGISLASIPKVQVRIAKARKTLEIEGMDLKSKNYVLGDQKTFSGRKLVRFNCQNKANASFLEKPVKVATLSSSTGILSFNKKHYRGDLIVSTAPDNRSCDLIYKTDMENYISSLLSKEMNGKWPIEALKAQAVAARTYAFHKMETKSSHD